MVINGMKNWSVMNKIILLVLISTMLVGFTDFPPPPECPPDCISGWNELFYIENSKYCNGGDYFIWHCVDNTGDMIYTSVCLSSIQKENYTVYFPYIVKE